ncbi:MAG: hypothetical protein Q8O55_08605 [Dehalococcoidales bacterium]|nr:hypothetical protein [Dehalococcoidales bacterium]
MVAVLILRNWDVVNRILSEVPIIATKLSDTINRTAARTKLKSNIDVSAVRPARSLGKSPYLALLTGQTLISFLRVGALSRKMV